MGRPPAQPTPPTPLLHSWMLGMAAFRIETRNRHSGGLPPALPPGPRQGACAGGHGAGGHATNVTIFAPPRSRPMVSAAHARPSANCRLGTVAAKG
eukprot:362673-Chlamydomonas_euryale.AAC.2